MAYEVEQKFRLYDPVAIRARLAELGVVWGEPTAQSDCYYAHPSRDFAATDGALRIRRSGGENCITYKGPKVDQTTKTRREIELALPDDDVGLDGWVDLLGSLGFRPVAEVRKMRTKAKLCWQGWSIEAALDEVNELGTFVELETSAKEDDLREARQAVASLADHLGLAGGVRESYLELLLSAR